MAKTDNHSWFWIAISLVIGISLGLQVWVAFFRPQPADVLQRLAVAPVEVLAEMGEMESRLRQEIAKQTSDRFTGEQAKELAAENNLIWPNEGVP